MIEILDKKNCVGCNACVQACPKTCISMHEDEQGFLYPIVDTYVCIHCNKCDRVCPVINQKSPAEIPTVYAARNEEADVRAQSSSGGVFYAVAKEIISDGGVVFGARFNDCWEVVHGYAETLDQLERFQGSKYVQSKMGDCYLQTKKFLASGRKVMFTGTPCQIAGLRLFLQKDYGEQLLLVDVVCHGVPSPLIWREYLTTLARPTGAPAGKNTVFMSLNDKPVITGISFRDKRNGWEKFGFSVRYGSATNGSGQNSVFQSVIARDCESIYEPFADNKYMRAFLNNLDLRPSCYACPAKSGKSGSDLTLADYWGIKAVNPTLYDFDGVSLVLVYTDKGAAILTKAKSLLKTRTEYEEALRSNPVIEHSVTRLPISEKFWRIFHKNGIRGALKFAVSIKPSLKVRLKRKLKSIVKRIIKVIS